MQDQRQLEPATKGCEEEKIIQNTQEGEMYCREGKVCEFSKNTQL